MSELQRRLVSGKAVNVAVDKCPDVTHGMVEHTGKSHPPFEAVLEQMLTQCLLPIERRIAGTILAEVQLIHEISSAIGFIFFW